MNLWIIAATIIGLLVIAGIVISFTGLTVADQPETIDCKTCEGSCTQDKNCGRASCGAVNGNGACGCGG